MRIDQLALPMTSPGYAAGAAGICSFRKRAAYGKQPCAAEFRTPGTARMPFAIHTAQVGPSQRDEFRAGATTIAISTY